MVKLVQKNLCPMSYSISYRLYNQCMKNSQIFGFPAFAIWRFYTSFVDLLLVF